MKGDRNDLQPGEAARIILWWRSHPVAAANAAAPGGKCPDALKDMGAGKVLHHLREMEAYKVKRKKKRRH